MPNRDGNWIYRVVHFCLRVAQPEYFRRIIIDGVPLDDPRTHLMVVANHPYGIQDAFLVSLCYTRPFYFVATALNFQTRQGDEIKPRRLRGWLLTKCHVLPIVRDRSEGHLAQNARTFAAAAERIAEGNALGIFAEGDSRGNQWRLLKLKAGAAQIALQVADALQASRDRLRIQVVGLTYTNWDRPFKSTVTLRLAEPFVVEPVDLSDKTAVRQARKEITDELTNCMRRLTVHIPAEHQSLAGKIAQFYCVDQRNDFARLQEVGEKVAQVSQPGSPESLALERQLDEYLALADELKVYPGEERRRRQQLPLIPFALPAYLGALTHFPILWATRKLVPTETTVMHALGSQRVTWGIGCTLAWYTLVGLLLLLVGVSWCGWWGVPLAVGLLVGMGWCGLVASRCFRHVNLMLLQFWPASRRFRRYRRLGAQLLTKLENYRQSDPQDAAAT